MGQREISILSEAKAPQMLSGELIRQLKDGREAILLCIDQRVARYSMAHLSALLGIDKGHFSRILNKKAHFPDEKRPELMRLCGNLAPAQFEAMQFGLRLDIDRVELARMILAEAEAA